MTTTTNAALSTAGTHLNRIEDAYREGFRDAATFNDVNTAWSLSVQSTTQPQEAAPPVAYSGRERGAWEHGYAAGRGSVAEAAPAAVPEQTGDTLEDNVRYLLEKCPYTVRDMSGERTGARWKEDLPGSLAITFLGMQQRLQEAAHPAEGVPAEPEGVDARLETWLTSGAGELHPSTKNLVVRFARALAAKLLAAEKKYGYTDGWRSADWMDECRSKLYEHLGKGDPRDVAAYCAFLWHHGESTTSPGPDGHWINQIKRRIVDRAAAGAILTKDVFAILDEVTAQPAGVPAQGDAELDTAFEAVRRRLCKLPRYSFHSDGYGAVRRVNDKSGSWIEFSAAHELFDPVAVDAAIAQDKEKPHA